MAVYSFNNNAICLGKECVSYSKAGSRWPVGVLISFVASFDMVLTNNHFFPVTKAYNHSLPLSLSPSV